MYWTNFWLPTVHVKQNLYLLAQRETMSNSFCAAKSLERSSLLFYWSNLLSSFISIRNSNDFWVHKFRKIKIEGNDVYLNVSQKWYKTKKNILFPEMNLHFQRTNITQLLMQHHKWTLQKIIVSANLVSINLILKTQ